MNIGHDPHAVLGLHEGVIRLWRPGAEKIYLEVRGKVVEARRVDPTGVFEYRAPGITGREYRVYHQSGLLAHDPYGFLPTFGEVDAYLFSQGLHYELYKVMGGRLATHEGVAGVKFTVWAPNAKSVALIADFNHWDARMNPMRSMGASGVWELFVPGIGEGEKYKFEVLGADDVVRVKADPFALSSELRPQTASIVANIQRHAWKDQKWNQKERGALNIYEVHLGSWKQTNGNFMNYREIARQLAAYCREMHFTHVELMPIAEHPLDESWGYQVTGFYAVTSRYGSPEDFQFFVDTLHQNGIGVILDWVPAHFPMDEFSLARFDGTHLFEHGDPRKGHHPHWNTSIFNYGRYEVVNFLVANALFWLDAMHIDGLRVDAVASMLYLDYGREGGDWIPNVYGGKENLEAIEFLKHLNSIVHERFPSALMIAEESTAFLGITHPLAWGGMGFDLKWNMGWMNDTLRYIGKDPIFRSHHQNDLTFGLIYAFSEKFALVLSHDEVVHGKQSLLAKMPGDDWQKFATVRLLHSYMMCHPGKKLLFMGGELGQWNEWNCKEQIHWFLLDYPAHSGLKRCVKEMNHLYKESPPLWEYDFDACGFEWIDFADRENSVVSYQRKGKTGALVCIHHFTPSYFSNYFVRLPNVKKIQEVFNTDREEFGGSGKINRHIDVQRDGFTIELAPLATQIFEVEFADPVSL
jgi:1,4-alpha-glucan branching enzyme